MAAILLRNDGNW